MAAAEIYANIDNQDKIPQTLQALAADNFRVFAGVQGAIWLADKLRLAFNLLQTAYCR